MRSVHVHAQNHDIVVMCAYYYVVVFVQEGLTALMLATQNGHVQVVQALLDAKADPNITESVSIFLATTQPMSGVLFIMFTQTAGWSALFFAAKSGYLQIIKLLVGKGADIGIRDKVTYCLSPFTKLDRLYFQNGLTAVEVSEDQDIIDELQRYQSETTTVITEVRQWRRQDFTEGGAQV